MSSPLPGGSDLLSGQRSTARLSWPERFQQPRIGRSHLRGGGGGRGWPRILAAEGAAELRAVLRGGVAVDHEA
eukprot:CAMPEP_0181448526 /NCGR_PEP_ID=MMETSP1110-20121109/27184_1 /TAXON_ID=174948 /ORGANISM="Symbiodinium sp., Strain CCMP421" /LENGTH=72 /DNA_ID=CAMNT_0023572675 /DNA_START=252 /DNA_END=467 /DNA_ORIENTATION=+